MSYSGIRHKLSQAARNSLFHTMTRSDIIERSAEGGIHIIMTPIGYELIYECATMGEYTTKAKAEAAAHTLAADHVTDHGPNSCDILDYTAAPITEETER